MMHFEATFYRWLMAVFLPFCAIAGGLSAATAADGQQVPLADLIWEARLKDYSTSAYTTAVKHLFDEWEAAGGEAIRPGEKGTVALKVFSALGPGLATPLNLVEAVIGQLNERGFADADIVIVDYFEQGMRRSGYLPGAASRRGYRFGEVDAIALDRGEHWDRNWTYENPLPSREASATVYSAFGTTTVVDSDEGRQSALPVPLMFDVDFWINLPVAFDHPALGTMGALANGTIWAVGNQSRFLYSPANAPVAVAEIAAVPEYRATWRLNIVSLEVYQFLGGPQFNAHYTRAEPLVWMSANPVALDYALFHKINSRRLEVGMPLIEPEPLFFEYAKAVGLGRYGADYIHLIR